MHFPGGSQPKELVGKGLELNEAGLTCKRLLEGVCESWN